MKLEIIEYPGYNLIFCHPFSASFTETISFVYNVLNSNFNKFGLNECIYNECLEFIKRLYKIQRKLLTEKPIFITGISYGGAISQILSSIIYNLKYGLEIDYENINNYNYTDLSIVQAVYSFGSFRICNKEGINYFKRIAINIYNYVACLDDKIDVVSFLPSCKCEENINTIYYDLWNDKEIKFDMSKYESGFCYNLLYLLSNLYSYKNWLNTEEQTLHNVEIYLKMKDKFRIQI